MRDHHKIISITFQRRPLRPRLVEYIVDALVEQYKLEYFFQRPECTHLDLFVSPHLGMRGAQCLESVVDVGQRLPAASEKVGDKVLVWKRIFGNPRRGSQEIPTKLRLTRR
jgi:hypothetical protein